MKLVSKKWKARFLQAQEIGDTFGYDDLEKLWGISSGNISAQFSKITSEIPSAVSFESDPSDARRKVLKLDYDLLVSDYEVKEEEKIPSWLSDNTRDAIVEILGEELPHDYEIEYVHAEGDWNPMFQRGGVKATVFEEGQKHPEFSVIFRVDNCIILNHGRVNE